MRRSQYRLAFFLLVSLNFVAESSLVAAQTTSIIEGTVSDQQHLAIVGAEITLSSPTIPRDLVTQTEGTGAYRIRGLPAGTYNLHVAKDGFTEKTYRELTITVNRLLILDVVMTISPVRGTLQSRAIRPCWKPPSLRRGPPSCRGKSIKCQSMDGIISTSCNWWPE